MKSNGCIERVHVWKAHERLAEAEWLRRRLDVCHLDARYDVSTERWVAKRAVKEQNSSKGPTCIGEICLTADDGAVKHNCSVILELNERWQWTKVVKGLRQSITEH